MLRLLLWFQIVFTVYELHFPLETGVMGLNMVNLLFLATLVALLLHGERDSVQTRAILRGALISFFLILGCAFLVAEVRAPRNTQEDITYLKSAVFYPLLYFMYLHSRQDLKNTRWMIMFVLVVAAIAGVQAVRQGLDYGIGEYVESHRASGPFGTNYAMANRAGVYYAMFLPMFLAIALLLRKQRLRRIAAVGAIAILSLAILFTYSRQSYFIALVATAVLFARRSVFLAAVLAVTLVALSGYLPDSVTERVAETHQSATVGGDKFDVSTESRWEIWNGATHMWAQYPLGVGLNRFQTVIGDFTPTYAGYDAHNFYVLTMSECGVLGLLILLWLIRRLFSLASMLRRHAAPEDSEASAWALGFSVVVLCMALGNLYGSPFLEGSVMGDFWILCGLLERYAHLKRLQIEGGPAAPRSPVPAARVQSTAKPLAPRRRVLVDNRD